MKFLSSINVNNAYALPLVDGAIGQALLTDGNGNAYWGTISTALSLNELTDVTISSPVTAQLLRYNGSQWVNWTPNFLTAESDTLATVVARGASTVNTITVGALNVNGNTTITGTLTVPKIEKNGSQIINSVEQSEFEGQVLKILSIQWVGTEIAKVESNGKITAGSFVKYGGTSSQFLKADGSVDSNTYLTSYSETDTLDSVTDRGNTTTNTIAVGGLTSSGLVYTNDIWSTQDAIRFMADEGVNIQPAQGESEVVFYFDWAEANIASIDTDGKFIGSGFKTPTGLSTQFLKADGSVDSSTYATQTWVGQNYATIDYVDDEISGVNTYVSTYFVPKTRTITINGTAYDLSADRSWTISTADNYISNVSLAGNLLSFTGVGSGFNGSVDLSGISVNLNEVETVYERVKNVSGALIQKGTPLAVVAGQTSGFISDVVPADASDPTKMPALFIANEDIDPEAEGEAVVFGAFSGVDTSLYQSGTVVYVAAGGGWTDTKPVWPNKIQNLGVITKSHHSNGGGIVTGVGRANDIPNLTAGKIWVGTANYPIESTTVHVDEANGRLGIGTTSPAYTLDVNGRLRVSAGGNEIAAFMKTTSSFGAVISYQDATTPGSQFVSAGAYGNNFIIATDGQVKVLVDSSGNVGIGTTSPSYKLQVAEDTYARIALHQTTTGAIWNWGNDGSNMYAYYTNTDVRALDITNNGNVGIGTTSPGYKLTVSGTINVSDLYTLSANADYAARYRTYAPGDGNWGLLTYAADPEYHMVITGASASSGYNRQFRVYDRPTSNSRFVVNFDGSGVGIGVVNPSAQLHVGNGTLQQQWIVNQSVAGWYSGIKLARGTGNNSSVVNNNFGFVTTDNGLEFVNFSNLTDATGSRFMVINNSGNVGVATTSPAEKLHVVGNIRIDGNSTAAILETGDKTAGEGGVVFESYNVGTTYGAFVDYVIYDTTRDNMRAGTLYAVWNTGEAVYTDTSTVDIGDTSNAVLYAEIDGTNVNLIVNGSTSFTIKYNLKLIK